MGETATLSLVQPQVESKNMPVRACTASSSAMGKH